MYNEAEYRGKNVKLNKPSAGDVKKYQVFVKDDNTGNVKKINFGDPNMEIKRDNPERRKNFRARHKCSTATDKTTPRYWSCKFWSKNKVSDLLKEIIEPESVDVSSIQMHDHLNELIWDDNQKLKNDVRKAMLLNAKRFIEFSSVQNLEFSDIILTGSMANYNYNENSDIDIHIIMDFSQISENVNFVSDYLKAKKDLWKELIPAQIKGHDVELYFQDINETLHATGTYSIMKNDWLNKPIQKLININTQNVQSKASDFINAIDELEANQNKKNWIDSYNILKNKIKKYRQSGLDKNGEYSTENFVFKILRNSGYLGKLVDLKNKYLQNELTLNEFEK